MGEDIEAINSKREGMFEGDTYYSAGLPKGSGKQIQLTMEEFDFLNELYNSNEKTNDKTLKAQRILSNVGYLEGEIDGFYDNKVNGAIKRYLMHRNDEDTVMKMMKIDAENQMAEKLMADPSSMEKFIEEML